MYKSKTTWYKSKNKWEYKKPEPSHVRGKCVSCKKNQQRKRSSSTSKSYKGKYKARYAPLCNTCERNRYGIISSNKIYRKHKLDTCFRCGFKPENKCQLDVDHIDKNHNNNDPDNLQTLCANCHRLKTHRPNIFYGVSTFGTKRKIDPYMFKRKKPG